VVFRIFCKTVIAADARRAGRGAITLAQVSGPPAAVRRLRPARSFWL